MEPGCGRAVPAPLALFSCDLILPPVSCFLHWLQTRALSSLVCPLNSPYVRNSPKGRLLHADCPPHVPVHGAGTPNLHVFPLCSLYEDRVE